LDRMVAVIRRGKGGKGRVVPIGDAPSVTLDRYLRVRRNHTLADSGPLWVGAHKGKTFGYYGHRSSVGYGQAPEPGGLVA